MGAKAQGVSTEPPRVTHHVAKPCPVALGSWYRPCPVPHPLDLIALVLGILFSLRQMDVSQRQPDRYPQISAADFEIWKRRGLRAYQLGASACFGRILLDVIVSYLMRQHPWSTGLRWTIGLSIDVTWVALVVLAWWRIRSAHALGRELGVEARAGSRPTA